MRRLTWKSPASTASTAANAEGGVTVDITAVVVAVTAEAVDADAAATGANHSPEKETPFRNAPGRGIFVSVTR